MISFLCSWVLITTFSQDVFRTAVPARILTYTTPPIPMYGYVMGAFFVGLFLGVFMAIYNYISLSAKTRKKGKTIKAMEKEIEGLKESRAYLQKELDEKKAQLDRKIIELEKKQSEQYKAGGALKSGEIDNRQTATPKSDYSLQSDNRVNPERKSEKQEDDDSL